ncbi:MAG: hypothetical protein K6T55_00340 [Syntrophobacterales bacterium]|nr:hypothetical protein [Syntrophobacterales bacterium]
MTTPEVEIVVYDAPGPASGGCGCGCDHHHGPGHGHSHGLNLEYETRALALTLEKDFPGRVRVKYVNVLKDPQALQLPQTKLLLSLAYPSPLVYINGRGRFAGALPVERLRQEVAELLGTPSPGLPG